MNTVEVRVRHMDDAKGARLGDFALDQLDEVVHSVAKWGAHVNNEDSSNDASGEFIADETGAYFEVLVGWEDA